jgi:hypothetical protein
VCVSRGSVMKKKLERPVPLLGAWGRLLQPPLVQLRPQRRPLIRGRENWRFLCVDFTDSSLDRLFKPGGCRIGETIAKCRQLKGSPATQEKWGCPGGRVRDYEMKDHSKSAKGKARRKERNDTKQTKGAATQTTLSASCGNLRCLERCSCATRSHARLFKPPDKMNNN